MINNRDNQPALIEYYWQVEAQSAGHLDCWFKDYLGGLDINHQEDGSTIITGKLPDMPAVYGLLLQLRDAGIVILSLQVERKVLTDH